MKNREKLTNKSEDFFLSVDGVWFLSINARVGYENKHFLIILFEKRVFFGLVFDRKELNNWNDIKKDKNA